MVNSITHSVCFCFSIRLDSDENSVSAVTVDRIVRCTRSRGIPDHNYSKQKNAAQFSDSSQPAVDSQPLPGQCVLMFAIQIIIVCIRGCAHLRKLTQSMYLVFNNGLALIPSKSDAILSLYLNAYLTVFLLLAILFPYQTVFSLGYYSG
jgi:hypothetical protein